jgi:hypothetical protein
VGVSETPPGSNNVLYKHRLFGGAVQGRPSPGACIHLVAVLEKRTVRALLLRAETAYCPFVAQYARQNGQWVTEGYRPRDLFLYDWDGDGQADHIGLCAEWFGYYARPLRENTGDASPG